MTTTSLGVVIIGRNEGERLRRCLESVLPQAALVVYVDSGSTDGSPAMARAMGAQVVDLDMQRPFTAARARNEGWRHLMQVDATVSLVQFVDGDCEVVPGWLDVASSFLRDHPAYAVVCGRRRERFPERSVYNRLCDEEWNTPLGETTACGGDAMMRMSALKVSGGFRDQLIAGEEPELCLRLRRLGWKLRRLDHDMTWHDAAMTRFGQWWKRSMRAGHAFEEGAWIHGGGPERHWVTEARRARWWGGYMPAALALSTLVLGPWALMASLIYPLQWIRLALRSGSAVSSGFLLLGKFAEAQGAWKFHRERWRGRSSQIIEYK